MRFLAIILCLTLLGCILVEARRGRGGRNRGRRPKPGEPVKTCTQDKSICVRTYGKSGRFTISRGNKSESHHQSTTISFFSIKEKNALGQFVGSAGPRKRRHYFQNFRNLQFSFSNKENTTYKGIKAIRYNFSTTLPGPNATLNIPMYLFNENGTLDVCDDEEIGVVDGALKYNIEIYNWKFCNGECYSWRKGIAQYGEFIDFVLHVKKRGIAYRGRRNWRRKGVGKGQGKGKRKGRWKGRGRGRGWRVKAQKFFFGDTTSIAFPSVFRSDGQCAEMPEGFPALRIKKRGSEYAVVFRFPKFNHSVVYDTVVNIQDKPGEPESTDTVIPNATMIPASVSPVNQTMAPTAPSDGASFQVLPTLSFAIAVTIFVPVLI